MFYSTDPRKLSSALHCLNMEINIEIAVYTERESLGEKKYRHDFSTLWV
jgi:hypothetical protein